MYKHDIMSNLESQIFTLYLNKTLEIDDELTILAISKNFENLLSSTSELSELSKRNLLTIISMIKHIKIQGPSELLEIGLFRKVRFQDEVGCAGDVLIPFAIGAATANGLGAALGLVSGMWNAYRNGCMEGSTSIWG